jgi:hypothetical protein
MGRRTPISWKEDMGGADWEKPDNKGDGTGGSVGFLVWWNSLFTDGRTRGRKHRFDPLTIRTSTQRKTKWSSIVMCQLIIGQNSAINSNANWSVKGCVKLHHLYILIYLGQVDASDSKREYLCSIVGSCL